MPEPDIGKIFTDFAPSLVRLACTTCRNPSDGEDRVSEVFRRIQANPGITMGNVKRFLVRAVVNECINWNKREQRETKKLKLFEAPPDQSEMREEITKAVLALPEEQRQVFVLKTDDETRTMADVADWLGISETTAASRVRHANETLRARMQKLQEELK